MLHSLHHNVRKFYFCSYYQFPWALFLHQSQFHHIFVRIAHILRRILHQLPHFRLRKVRLSTMKKDDLWVDYIPFRFYGILAIILTVMIFRAINGNFTGYELEMNILSLVTNHFWPSSPYNLACVKPTSQLIMWPMF